MACWIILPSNSSHPSTASLKSASIRQSDAEEHWLSTFNEAKISTALNGTLSPDETTQTRVVEAYAELPLSFEANEGQTDSQVKFTSRGSGYSVFLTPTEAVLALNKPSTNGTHEQLFHPNRKSRSRSDQVRRAVLRLKFVGANRSAELMGLEELPGKSNYFNSNDPAKWRTEINNYSKVRYNAIYPGVDIVFYGKQRQLEYDLVVTPGADPATIELAFQGAQKLHVDLQGDLIIQTVGGKLRQHRPEAYQEVGGIRRAVVSHYTIKGKNRVGFQVAGYDVSKPLVIDPVLSYSTYLGGNSRDAGFGIAVDSSGSAYLTGGTFSIDFPTTNSFQPSFGNGPGDAFVTKLNPSGSALVYSTYLGGNGGEYSTSIALDPTGNAYVTGNTGSPNFPTTPGVYQPAQVTASRGDIFVTKLNQTGSALIYSTHIGGTGGARATDIALDSEGNAYLTGDTTGNGIQGWIDFPTTAGAFQTTFKGHTDAFLTKLNAEGTALVYSTFLGGSDGDYGRSIALDKSGCAYVIGNTFSSNFPVTPGAFQATRKGGLDAFVTKINSTGSELLYSTLLGGTGNEGLDWGVGDIALDSSGNAYLVGFTDSTDFPTTPGSFQQVSGGGNCTDPWGDPITCNDAFVVKLNSTGTGLVYSTYLGGSGDDKGSSIAVNTAGDVYVAGTTRSSSFPVMSGAFQAAHGGGLDAFVAKINSAGTNLLYSTYLGGNDIDTGYAIALSSSGDAYVTGETWSGDFPTTTGAFATNQGGANPHAYIAKINDAPTSCSITCSTSSPTTGVIGTPISFGSTAASSLACAGAINYDWDFGDGSPHSSQQNPSYTYVNLGTFTWTMTASLGGSSSCAKTGTITITQACTPVSIRTHPANQTITNGQTATLSVGLNETDPDRAALYYCEWFEGSSGDTSTPVSSGPFDSTRTFTTPALIKSTSYWVRVSFNHDLTCAANSSAGTVTVAPLHTPVLIVPGVYATDLYKGADQLWLNISKALLSGDSDSFLDPLEIKPNLEPIDPSIVTGDVIRKIDPPFSIFDFDYTQGLIEELKSRGYKEGTDIFLFPYDWRFGVSATAVDALQNKINEIISKSGSSKVNIVAHSTGGLIAKKYIQHTATPKIDKVVFVGVPNLGAPKAINVLLTGDTGLVGHNNQKMKKLALNMPIVYELSPSRKYFSVKGSFMRITTAVGLFSSTVRNLDDTETRDYLVNDREANQQAFTNSTNLHTPEFDNFDLRTKGVDFYNIIGCGKGTIGRVNEQRYLLRSPTYSVTYTPGDGTVPVESALSVPVDPSKLFYAVGADHGKMPSQPGIRQKIAKIFSNDSSSTSGIYNALQCQLNGKVIFMASPVAIMVTDQNGNYSGPVEDGTIINNIPNADYSVIGEHKSIYLPDDEGQTYSIQLKGTGEGTFTLKIDDITNNETVGSEIFPALPVTTQLVGSLQVQTNESVLRLDTNGNGTVDQTLTPPVVVTQQQLNQRQNPNAGTITLRAPEANPPPGTYPQTQSIALSAPDWDMIYYTADGTDPSFGKGQLYTGTVATATPTTIKAIGCFADGSCSNVVTFPYVISTMQLSQASYAVGEDGGSVTIQITRTTGSSGEARINYSTSNGTATAGSDFTSASGTLVFAEGDTTKTFNIPITNDSFDETDETFIVRLSDAIGTSGLGEPSIASVIITDNDPPPAFSLADISIVEGNAGTTNAVFAVKLSTQSALPTTVNISTEDGTATNPSDYQTTSNTLTFNPGELQKTFAVLVNGDTLPETNETFFVNLSTATNATIAINRGVGLILNDDASLIQLSASRYGFNEDGLRAEITIMRLGDLSKAARVNYSTHDSSGLAPCATMTGNASSRCDYATSVGTLRFAPGENTKSLFIPLVDDAYVEGAETFTLELISPADSSLGSPNSATIEILDNDTAMGFNPISQAEYFIRQHYIDFLGREPEPAGLQGWLGVLNNCGITVSHPCDRIEVSSGFFRSEEFQQRGYFIYRFYSAVGKIPHYDEFMPDFAKVSGFLSVQQLEENKAAFVEEFVGRNDYQLLYSSLKDNTDYVDALLRTVGLPNHPSRLSWISMLNDGSMTRARVLRTLTESDEMFRKFYTEAFVIMQYFGYLRRDADISYLQWIQTMNQSNGDYRTMINGFLNSLEYRNRFGN